MARSCSDSYITIASWIRRLRDLQVNNVSGLCPPGRLRQRLRSARTVTVKERLGTGILVLRKFLSWSLLLLGLAIAPPSWSQQVERLEIVETPAVDRDRGEVKLRLKAYGRNNRPIAGFQDTDFQVMVDCPEGGECPLLDESNLRDWKSPREAEPPESWTIVLLDLSGSMKNKDTSGTAKLYGAIQAMREFDGDLAERAANKSNIAIVPFGESGPLCPKGGYPVTENELNNFLKPGDAKLKSYFEYLAGKREKLCASTNIYKPLSKAVRFLGNSADARFHPPEDSDLPQPRLSILLLSDGFHNRANETQEFQDLKSLLRRNPKITVHTLGYGLTPEELGEKCGLRRAFTRYDLSRCSGTVEQQDFVDKERLSEIAAETGGIAAFSGNATDIAEDLWEFLNALLGEYEITYRHPQIDRAELHQVRVTVTSDDGSAATAEAPYTIPWVAPSLPQDTRIKIVLFVLGVVAIGGLLPFWIWARSIERKYQ